MSSSLIHSALHLSSCQRVNDSDMSYYEVVCGYSIVRTNISLSLGITAIYARASTLGVRSVVDYGSDGIPKSL